MMKFLKRCWQNRWTRRFVWSAITLVTLYLLLCAWLNWTWGRQWTATANMLQAEGETLDFRALANDPLPESENFCAIPLLKDISLVVDNDSSKGEPAAKRKKLEDIKLPEGNGSNKRPKFPSAGFGKATDLKAWAEWLRKDGSVPMPADSGNAAQDLVTGLTKYGPVVSELTSGLDRAQAQWTPEWKNREMPDWLFGLQMPHITAIRAINRTLALRSTAAARAGDSTRAHAEILVMTRIAQANLNDPLLVGMLVGAADTATICGSTWELCATHSGTAQDFAKLESAISSLDFHRATLRAFRGEMAACVNSLQSLKRNPSTALGMILLNGEESPTKASPASIAMRAVPLGFFDASAAVMADQEFKYLIKPLRDHGWREALDSSAEHMKVIMDVKEKIWTHPEYMMAVLMTPAMSSTIHNAIYAQSITNQAVIACALERHRIKNGSYPDSLDSLKLTNGKPLPLDVMNDKPMGYRKTPDGAYMLWSVGIDGKDDGGKRVLDNKNPEDTKFSAEKYSGDWVWDFQGEK